MIFTAQKIIHTQPQLSVVNADTSSIPITYPQIKQSLGSDIYNVQTLYIYSDNINQLQGQIQYVRFDASGKQTIKSIITTVDPYTTGVSLYKNVEQPGSFFILNGNSNFSSSILPQTDVQIKFFGQRTTSSFVRGTNNFVILENVFRLKGFNEKVNNYNLNQYVLTDKYDAEDISKNENFTDNNIGNEDDEVVDELKIQQNSKKIDTLTTGFLAFSAAILGFIIIKKLVDVREH